MFLNSNLEYWMLLAVQLLRRQSPLSVAYSDDEVVAANWLSKLLSVSQGCFVLSLRK